MHRQPILHPGKHRSPRRGKVRLNKLHLQRRSRPVQLGCQPSLPQRRHNQLHLQALQLKRLRLQHNRLLRHPVSLASLLPKRSYSVPDKLESLRKVLRARTGSDRVTSTLP